LGFVFMCAHFVFVPGARPQMMRRCERCASSSPQYPPVWQPLFGHRLWAAPCLGWEGPRGTSGMRVFWVTSEFDW